MKNRSEWKDEGLEDGEISSDNEVHGSHRLNENKEKKDENLFESYGMKGKPREFLTTFVRGMPSPEMVVSMEGKEVRKTLCEVLRVSRMQDKLFEENACVLKKIRDVREYEYGLVYSLLQSMLETMNSRSGRPDLNAFAGLVHFLQQNTALKEKYDALLFRSQQLNGTLSPNLLSPNGAIGTAALPIPSLLNMKPTVCPPPPRLPHMMCFPPPPIVNKVLPLPPQPPCFSPGFFPDFSRPPPPIMKPSLDQTLNRGIETFTTPSVSQAQASPAMNISTNDYLKGVQLPSPDICALKQSQSSPCVPAQNEVFAPKFFRSAGTAVLQTPNLQTNLFDQKRFTPQSSDSSHVKEDVCDNEPYFADLPSPAQFRPFVRRCKRRCF